MIKKQKLRLTAALILFATLALLAFQNCGDIRVKGPDKEIPLIIMTPTTTVTTMTVTTTTQSLPSVGDEGHHDGRLDMGLSTIYPAFTSVQWTTTGHFLVLGPCSPINQVGMSGWPGGQYLFDSNGVHLATQHVCRDSGYSLACPEGGGCQLGNGTSFIGDDTFVRMAQSPGTGTQRAPMMYKIKNNRFIFMGQLFTPHPYSSADNYPAEYMTDGGVVVNRTLILLKTKEKNTPVPNSAAAFPYRLGIHLLDTNLGTTAPFQFVIDWPDHAPETILPMHSIGNFVITEDAKIYKWNESSMSFSFSRTLSDVHVNDFLLRDSFDPNVFYLPVTSSPGSLKKYIHQNDSIVDAGVLTAQPGERIVAASGNIVLKSKFGPSNDSAPCPQLAEIIVEVNGVRATTPILDYDENEYMNEFCRLRPRTPSCIGAPPFPTPGPRCRSVPVTAGISPTGVILYIERVTERLRVLRVNNTNQ